jgi:hypothetical protein
MTSQNQNYDSPFFDENSHKKMNKYSTADKQKSRTFIFKNV